MWPVSEETANCKVRTQLNTTAIIATPWDDKVGPGMTDKVTPCSYKRDMPCSSAQELRRWCVMYAVEPFYNSPKPRMAQIGDRWFPTAADQER
jgi:hypothetical protein